jgi:uncharacterized membrane protein
VAISFAVLNQVRDCFASACGGWSRHDRLNNVLEVTLRTRYYYLVDFSQSIIPLIEDVPVIRIILASILVFFLPGFAWSLVFFYKNINIIERIALSIGLSIALVTLSVLALNVLLDVRINGFNAVVTIVVITVIPFGIYLIRRYLMHKSGASGGE